MEKLGLPDECVKILLNFSGAWEIMLGLLFIVYLLTKLNPAVKNFFMNMLFSLSILTFIGFSLFDIIVGDRAELLEHGTYIAVVIISYICIRLEEQKLVTFKTQQ